MDLYEVRKEECTYCKNIFNNRYDLIIHKAKHLRIPCLLTGEQLRLHNEIDHVTKVANTEPEQNNVIKIEAGGADPWTMLMKEDLYRNIALIDWDDCLTDEAANSEDETPHEPDSTTGDLMVPQNDVRSKFVFEDDEDDEIVLRYEEDVDSTDTNSEIKDLNQSDITATTFQAVHHDDLMAPGDYKCNNCGASFPNRFTLICHETTHVTIRRRNRLQLCYICDYYIAGNYIQLRKHYLKNHPGHKYKILNNWKKCNICHLKCYSVAKHNENYHSIYACPNCSGRFDCGSKRDEHAISCKPQHKPTVSKVIKVCELCCLFFKNTQKHRYRDMGVYSEKGARITCERCEKKFFEVNLVEMTRQAIREYARVDKKPMTNMSRLRNMQQRLKMYNKRLQCYLCSYILCALNCYPW